MKLHYQHLVSEKIEEIFRIMTNPRKEEHQFLLKFGPQINRAFFNRGLYSKHRDYGEIIKDTAITLKDYDTVAKVLIEAISWPSVIEGNKFKARVKLVQGIFFARKSNNRFLEAKGLRHLAAICINKRHVKKRDIKKATKKLEKAKRIAELVEDYQQRADALAAIYYGFAELHLQDSNCDLEEAEIFNRIANDYYRHVDERSKRVKVFSQLGKIRELQGRLQQALEAFHESYTAARNDGRRDYEILSLKGLIRIYRRREQIDFIRKYEGELRKLEAMTSYALNY